MNPAAASHRSRRERSALIVGMISLGATYLWELRADYSLISAASHDPLYACAMEFKEAVSGNGLLVASGEVCRRPNGEPAAGNKPYMFYWLDRKGFNLCEDEQSIDRLTALAGRGATFFIGEKEALGRTRGFEAALRDTFPVVAECDAAILFRLSEKRLQNEQASATFDYTPAVRGALRSPDRRLEFMLKHLVSACA